MERFFEGFKKRACGDYLEAMIKKKKKKKMWKTAGEGALWAKKQKLTRELIDEFHRGLMRDLGQERK